MSLLLDLYRAAAAYRPIKHGSNVLHSIKSAAHQQHLFRQRNQFDRPVTDVGLLDHRPTTRRQDTDHLAHGLLLIEQVMADEPRFLLGRPNVTEMM